MSTAAERAAEAVAGLRRYGYAGPFAGARLVGPAWFYVGRKGGRIELRGIWVSPEARGEGRADNLLRMVLHFADAHRVAVELRVAPFAGEPVTADGLRAWYARHGFKRQGLRSSYMVREPLRASGAGARVAPVQGVQHA